MRVLNDRATLDASINVFATRFPLTAHTDKTPIIDDVTYSGAAPTIRPASRRIGAGTTTRTSASTPTSHDMKIGYMYQWYAPRYTEYGAPGPAGTAGHFYIGTTNGVPSAFWTDNGPVSNVNVLKNHALFFQDKFQVTSKLTLNYGIRFDQYRSSYPEQRFGVNGNSHASTTPVRRRSVRRQTVTPARDVVTFNTVVPRVALIYDPFGNSRRP